MTSYSQAKFPGEGESIKRLGEYTHSCPDQRTSITRDHLAPDYRHLAMEEKIDLL